MNKESNISGILICILYFILGVVLIGATKDFIKTFNYILVIISAIVGIIQIISFFVRKKYKDNNYGDLLFAVVFIWVSLVLGIYYEFMMVILPILFGLWMFMMFIDMLSKYINIKDKKYLILSIVSIVVGLILIINPGSVIFTYLKITGVYLIVISILYFIELFKKKKEDVIE